ncbi:hypothetical protein FRC01_014564, partial [Tulasnella sp. 417]
MSIDELKRTVSRPYRFHRAIEKQLLANRTPVHLKLEIRTQDAVLIPGGRWLVVTGRLDPPWPPVGGSTAQPSEPATVLQVWDIRPPTSQKLSLVTSVELQPHSTHLFVQPATTEAEGVALIIVNYDTDLFSGEPLLSDIYSFHPFADEASRLRPFHSIKAERDSYLLAAQHAVTMGNNLIWALRGASFLVVNWRSREWAFLHAKAPKNDSLELISINDDCDNPWMTCLHPELRSIFTFGRPQMKPWPIHALGSAYKEELSFIDQVSQDPIDCGILPFYLRRRAFRTWGEPRTTFWQDEALRKSFIFTSEARICCFESVGFPDDGNLIARMKQYYEPERALPNLHPAWYPIRITSETIGGRKLALLKDGWIVSCSDSSGEGR